MKIRLKPLAVSLCLLGMISTPAFAVVTNNQTLNTLARKVSQLEQEVSTLKSEKHTSVPQSANTTAKPNGDTSEYTASSRDKYLPVDVEVPGQSFVSSGPYIGIPLEFSGSNLIINSPSVNRDVALMKIRQHIHSRLQQLGITEEQRPHILLSGIVEGQAWYQSGPSNTSSNIDLTSANLDAYILGPSNWLSSLIEFAYDNTSGSLEGSFSANNDVTVASRVFLNQGFVTIGDLDRSPLYGTFGQLYVPFGTYSSNMITSPLTKTIARTKARAVVLGYAPTHDNSLYASTYVFKGDSFVSSSHLNNGGINLGYHFHNSKIHGDVGAGYMVNLADALGMQVTLNAPFWGGFGGTGGTGNEHLVHRVGAYDLRGMVGLFDNIDLLAEYIFASSSFSPADLQMNGHGAKPQALDAEAAYTFQLFNRPTSIAVGYGMSKDALALTLPAERYSVVLNTSIWRSTLQSLEFRHDINYSSSNNATGSGVTSPLVTGPGKPDNALTLQFDVYF